MHTLLAACLAGPAWLWAQPQVFTLTAPQTGNTNRIPFNQAVLTLALEKTRAAEGDYRIAFTPRMNTARALEEAKRKNYPNLLVLTTFQNALLDAGLDYVRFPVDLGFTGYRICFVSPQARDAVAKATSLEQLRQFSVGQGIGWADVGILRYNQFKVVEVPLKDSLFRMVALGRVDLFCRGMDELEPEYVANKSLPGLDYDRSFALSYKLPRFFLGHQSNADALKRVTRGLLLAYKDGSLKTLHLRYFGSALQFAKLPQRRLVKLETPNIDRIDFDYQRYYLDPFAKP
ncbi:hypothetical protein RS694_00445 [Rhodoferax saidenbachensis]|uniref:Solute-binding protein family 3/N-terminal domain-containing protein n=1 Tax=Rhodoferax saidenbachensis TaxID=1484693 RepID=A0A1P8K590_9BURK|nr:hypothetical protein RS694_00445 [Rhodoferax saidenbachensis]